MLYKILVQKFGTSVGKNAISAHWNEMTIPDFDYWIDNKTSYKKHGGLKTPILITFLKNALQNIGFENQ